MDSRIPYSQSSGYVGLLHSQHESVLPENSGYESFYSGSSEIPQFSSQQCEAPIPPTDRTVERGKRQKWTPADDEVLISAWLNTSKDCIVGNDQKSGTFWARVGEYFYGAANGEKRAHLGYKQRWHKINDLVNKFCGSFAAAERKMSSGQNDNDVLKVAHDIYYSDYNTKFTLEHAWCVMRYEQKWLNLNTKPSGSSKRKPDETGTQASTTSVGDEEARPEGVKAAKARRANGQGKSVADYAQLWELRKEDLAEKKILTKLAILDSLIAKKDQLTEAEEVAKQKLLAELI